MLGAEFAAFGDGLFRHMRANLHRQAIQSLGHELHVCPRSDLAPFLADAVEDAFLSTRLESPLFNGLRLRFLSSLDGGE